MGVPGRGTTTGRLRLLASERMPVASIAQALGRTPQAVITRARRGGIALPAAPIAPRAGLRWTAAEDELLRVHAALNPAVLCELLGRSPSSITAAHAATGVARGALPPPPGVPARRAHAR